MAEYHLILERYWGFKKFRPMQEEIIRSVLGGNDTLALLPTGGGKSLTFQVPALATEGICIVITPLIALMKDQVEKLHKLDVRAQAIFSGMTYNEIDVALDNCIYGNYKFLYISPERIGTELFSVRYRNMPVNLIAVDEAHCISQWGYDFRPSYLNIAELRKLNPEVPVLALTATATKKVAEDIQEKLHFRKKNVLLTSFERKNLVYSVKYVEDKGKELISITKKIKGDGIIYVRSRRKCREIASVFNQNGINADYYHAGLKHEIRAQRQDNWTQGKTRIMVATNAFGMGIDKPDVRFVIHLDMPDSPEAYFQEAGRAGRDGRLSYAVLLFSQSDKNIVSHRVTTNFPDIETIRNIYQAAANYCRIPYGGGKGMAIDFNLIDFSSQYKFNSYTAYSSLKILEKEGYVELTDEMNNPSRIKFILSRDDLYRFQVANARFDAFIKLLLRSYTGVFTDYAAIDEVLLAKRAGVETDIVFQYLNRLSTLKVINYIPQRKTPLLVFTEERLEDKSIYISPENHKLRKERFTERLEYMLTYAANRNKCRSQVLLRYFDETDSEKCGLCDVCKQQEENELKNEEFELMQEEIKGLILLEPLTLNQLIDKIPFQKEKLIKTIQWLLDNNYLKYNNEKRLYWVIR